MKIAIYHPNLNLYGGGETVALTIAETLSKQHKVDIFTPHSVDKTKLEKFFGLDLSDVNIVNFGALIDNLPTLHSLKSSILLKSAYKQLNEYDVVFDTATNGMFDRKLDATTICYVHFPNFPRKKKGIKSLLNRFLIFPDQAFEYDTILCNSNFTKKYVQKMTDKEIHVVYPPVDIERITPAKKKYNRIVTIGRFTEDKKHEIMIKAFKKLYPKAEGWEFHIIGSFREGTSFYKGSYMDNLKELAQGAPITFHLNMPNDEVLRFLEDSKIYWHARGYGETDPVEYENFGITTVEAMAAGCIPIVINKGAQPEIVKDRNLIWSQLEELISITQNNLEKYHKINKKEVIQYSKYIFQDKIGEFIYENS